MRSEKMAWLFELMGLEVFVLKGGYKAFRAQLLEDFKNLENLIVLQGPTGSGKTQILQQLENQGEQIIDVRPPKMAGKKPVPGAKNIPLGQLRGRLDEIDASRPVFTICQVGKTSYFAARILANRGFDARSILGGALHQL